MEEKRVKESEIVKPALKIIKDNPGISTSELIKELQKIIELYPGDKEILAGRNDTKFSQIVRNLISHKKIINLVNVYMKEKKVEMQVSLLMK